MEVLGLLLVLVLFLVAFAILIGSIVFVVKDAEKQKQNVVLWVVLYIFFGNLALSIYLFVTNRIGWGLFWLLVYPTILGGLIFISLIFIGAANYGAGSY